MGIIVTDGYSDLTMRRFWKWGIPAPLWLKNLKMIEQTIRELNLQPVSPEVLPAETYAVPMMGVREKEEARLVLKRPPIPGGIKVPHLHFKGDIYILDEKQWKDFSGKIIKDFQAKLSRVNAVGFEQVMEISEAVDGLM